MFQTRLAFDPGTGGVVPREYDVTSDGQRFLLNQHVADSTDGKKTRSASFGTEGYDNRG